MASKLVVFAVIVSICRVESQAICLSNPQSSSNIQPSCGCGQQTQTIQLQPSNSNRGLKASPQLQIVPGQNCNLQAIPLSQLLSQASNVQRPQSGCNSCNSPIQSIQIPSVPRVSSSPAQCPQPSPPCNPTVITSPVSAITIPPSCTTTVIDCSISNGLVNALQMLIANDFINSALNNNIIQQDCAIPVETCSSGFDLSSFINNLNSNQMSQDCQCQTPSYQTDQPSCYDLEIEPENSSYDYSSFINYLRQKGQTACQISNRPSCQCGQSSSYNPQPAQSQSCDIDSSIINALTAYLGLNTPNACSNSCTNVAEVVFPEEIPAQLICNYGYMPTTVPVVSFSVAPVGDCSNFIVGTQCQ